MKSSDKKHKPISPNSKIARYSVRFLKQFLVKKELIAKFKSDIEAGKFFTEEELERERTNVIKESLDAANFH